MKLNAYTLSEVLITLGIIGVISAITIPAVIAEFQHQQYLTSLKKAYSILQQAENNIFVDYGMNSVYLCNQNDSYCLGDIYKEYLKALSVEKYIPSTNAKMCSFVASNLPEKHYCIVSADGIIYDFDMEYSTDTIHNAKVVVDINGTKKPNVYGKDIYMFEIDNNKIVPYYRNNLGCKRGDGISNQNYNCAHEYLTKNSAK